MNSTRYFFNQDLETTLCTFPDSVAIYSTYSGNTYLFNPIVNWIIEAAQQQPFSLALLFDKLLLDIANKDEQKSLQDLLNNTINNLLLLKIIKAV